jgi:hypothetical protein
MIIWILSLPWFVMYAMGLIILPHHYLSLCDVKIYLCICSLELILTLYKVLACQSNLIWSLLLQPKMRKFLIWTEDDHHVKKCRNLIGNYCKRRYMKNSSIENVLKKEECMCAGLTNFRAHRPNKLNNSCHAKQRTAAR